MLGMQSFCPFLDFAAQGAEEPFTLVDVGCSGGLHPVWRRLEPRLRAAAYDIMPEEVARLTAAESNPAVRYFSGAAGVRSDHPFARRRGARPNVVNNPWGRLSVWRTQQLRLAGEAGPPPPHWSTAALAQSPPPLPEGGEAPPADPENLIVVPEHLRSVGIDDADFVKIDIDGGDLEVLSSFEAELAGMQVLAVGIEVNFFGTDNPADNSFHNVDRLLRQQGFDLVNLESWRYSTAALPGRYVWGAPAATDVGRIVQGDALYVRDLGAPGNADFRRSLPEWKLLNYMAITALFGLPDLAAEALLMRETEAGVGLDGARALDLLTEQVRGPGAQAYAEHMRAFEQDDPWFYPG